MLHSEMKVNVLGTEYTVLERKLNEDNKLERLNGYCDTSVKLIVLRDVKEVEDDEDSQKNLQVYRNRLLRHELIHAFLFESGLDDDWAVNEQMIDFFAMQFEKLEETFSSLGILRGTVTKKLDVDLEYIRKQVTKSILSKGPIGPIELDPELGHKVPKIINLNVDFTLDKDLDIDKVVEHIGDKIKEGIHI